MQDIVSAINPLSLTLFFCAILVVYQFPRHRIIRNPAFGVLLLCWVWSSPIFTESALKCIENETQSLINLPKDTQVIVILGGGTYTRAPEYSGVDYPNERTLARLAFGSELHRRFGIPIFLTGGNPNKNTTSEAEQMKRELAQTFGISPIGIEDNSFDTAENAAFSAATLKSLRISRIAIVTHAFHMPRAARLFRREGFAVIEAPTRFTTSNRHFLLNFIPSTDGVNAGALFFRELIACARSGINPFSRNEN